MPRGAPGKTGAGKATCIKVYDGEATPVHGRGEVGRRQVHDLSDVVGQHRGLQQELMKKESGGWGG